MSDFPFAEGSAVSISSLSSDVVLDGILYYVTNDSIEGYSVLLLIVSEVKF